jgi:hypothetical protein
VNRFSSGLYGEIVRDVVRTFQSNELFHENQFGQIMLTRILIALALAQPGLGYCQVYYTVLSPISSVLTQKVLNTGNEFCSRDFYLDETGTFI